MTEEVSRLTVTSLSGNGDLPSSLGNWAAREDEHLARNSTWTDGDLMVTSEVFLRGLVPTKPRDVDR